AHPRRLRSAPRLDPRPRRAATAGRPRRAVRGRGRGRPARAAGRRGRARGGPAAPRDGACARAAR
ncbi:MAG: hypothetical protein AVDCRST_MAG30-215, partial [uncultured Solirubrobacteraceae bacterium]